MVYFEPETSSNNLFQNIVFLGVQNYQTALYYDAQLNGDGVVSQRLDNVHASGASLSYPVIDKGGFGRFWNFGGWNAPSSNFSNGIDYQVTQNCGMPSFVVNGSGSMVYIFNTEMTYSFGTFQVDNCGLGAGYFGYNVYFHQMLSESAAGPAFKVNTLPYGLSGITFDQGTYSDPVGGFASPYFDLTNAAVSGSEFNYMECGTGYQPLLETGTASVNYQGVIAKGNQGVCSGGIGAINYRFDNMSTNGGTISGYNTTLTNGSQIGAGQIANPTAAPTVTVLTGGGCGGFPSAGTYTYGVTALDSQAVGNSSGHETLVSTASAGVAMDGATQCAQINEPALPTGSVYWYAYRLSGPGSGSRAANNGSTVLTPVTAATIVDSRSFTSGQSVPISNTTLLNIISPSGVSGVLQGSTISTQANCSATASPAICGTAPAGLVQVAAAATTLVVDTTAVTANSRFSFTYVTTGTGCSAAPGNIGSLLHPYVSAIAAGTSFTITLPVAPTTNPVCVSYTVEN
jgi:hypothetical protein